MNNRGRGRGRGRGWRVGAELAPGVGPGPLLALVGRPNVGKSSLFNRLTRTRDALVDDTPGLTRDRKYGVVMWNGRPFRVVDTGGFEFDAREPLLARMREQAELAVEEADLIFFVLDARTGPMADDLELAKRLRRCGKPVVCVVNKSEGNEGAGGLAEFHRLGMQPVVAISATHGLGVDDLLRVAHSRCPLPVVEPELEQEVEEESEVEAEAGAEARAEAGAEAELVGGVVVKSDPADKWRDEVVRVAIVGCPNAGKSTLVNRLLGEERLVTSDQPGTTRDSVDAPLVDAQGHRYVLVDTAGLRRKARIALRIEKYAAIAALNAMDRAKTAVLVLDAVRGITEQDQRVAGHALDAGCGLVFAVNKWDAVPRGREAESAFRRELGLAFPRFSHAPVVFLSGRTGHGVDRLLPVVRRVWEAGQQRVSTGVLNRWLAEVEEANPHPRRSGRPVRFRFASQVRVAPPLVVFFVSRPEEVEESYRRYLENQLREKFGFQGVPLRIDFRGGKENPYADKQPFRS
ncbi:MAG: ribosome biogenesis GTPase Der [Magnetococcales bacterium]|nr:ribosome biogenesis GTPase Der [Magnetococcales bacterium]